VECQESILKMSRKNNFKKRYVFPEKTSSSGFNDYLVNMLVHRILKKGKKALARRIFTKVMIQLQESTKEDPIEILRVAVKNITPKVEVKSKRVGGSTYQVPKEVSLERGTTLALRWLLNAAKARPERGIIVKLTSEILDASQGNGGAVRKKQEIKRMADANKAFSHFRV